MTDEQLEQLLHRYSPAAPPADVRGRVLAAAARPVRVPMRTIDWTLLGAAAVLLLAAMATMQRPATTTVGDDESAWQRNVAIVASSIGGGDAVNIAQTLVPRPDPAVTLERLEEEGQW
jgi:hypothetical protein